jgi:replication-associated recombination protein RarA
MPEGLEETIFYKPLARGFEARLKERLEGIREWIRKQREAGN